MMKIKSFIFLLILLTATAVFAQPPEELRVHKEAVEKSRLRTIALEKAINISPASKALAAKVFGNDSKSRDKAIIEAGKSGDKDLIPLLKVLADDENFYAPAALAKLGDEEYLTRIIAETEKTRPFFARRTAVQKLLFFDHRRAMRRLSELLDDTERPDSQARDYMESTVSEIIINRLEQTAENPPRLPNGNIDRTITAWKAWFARNKHLIE